MLFRSRFHPYAIIPAEMRGAEALTAVEAGRTGHVIVSTLHAKKTANRSRYCYDKCMEGILCVNSFGIFYYSHFEMQ